jgi:hypothetical protein
MFLKMCTSRHFVLAQKLFILLRAWNFCSDESMDMLCAIVITGLSRERRVEYVVFFFEQLEEVSGSLGPMAFNAVVGLYA